MQEKIISKSSAETKKKLKQKARKELNEVEEEVPKRLSELRKLLKEDESLYCPLDEKFLIRFLRARKFDVDRTLCLIKQYYNMRSKNVELFEDLCPESVSHVFAEQIQAVLDERDSSGRQVFVFRAGKWNPDTVTLDDIFRSNYLFLEEMTASEETQICGVTAIVDYDGMGFYQARKFTPKHAIRMIQIIQNCFPCRFQEFHMINQPYVFDLLYAVVKPFLSEKIKKRIYFHGRDLDSLHKRVNSQILPEFLGGSVPISETIQRYNHNLMKKNQHYKEMCRFGFNKSKSKHASQNDAPK